MIAVHWLAGLALFAAPAGSQPVGVASQQAGGASDSAPKPPLCEGEKFEFRAGDELRPTKITLCSNQGATTADLVRMLESAADRIERIDKLPIDRKSALAAQIRAKIVEVQARDAPASPPPENAPVAAPPMPAPPMPAPPMPAPPVAVMPVASEPNMVAVPPRPAAPTSPRPRLTVQCLAFGATGAGGRCGFLERDTRLAIRADGDLPAGTSLRFLRKGQLRSELALAPMRAGQTLGVSLPQRLCAGVVASRVEIHIVQRPPGAAGSAQIVETLGPFPLRC